MVSSHLLAIAMFGKAEENREKKEEHDDADPSHRDDISHFPNSHSLLQAGTCAWKSQCGILKKSFLQDRRVFFRTTSQSFPH